MEIPKSLEPYAMAFGLVALGGCVAQEYKPVENGSQNIETKVQNLRSVEARTTPANCDVFIQKIRQLKEPDNYNVHFKGLPGLVDSTLAQLPKLATMEEKLATFEQRQRYYDAAELATEIAEGYGWLADRFAGYRALADTMDANLSADLLEIDMELYGATIDMGHKAHDLLHQHKHARALSEEEFQELWDTFSERIDRLSPFRLEDDIDDAEDDLGLDDIEDDIVDAT